MPPCVTSRMIDFAFAGNIGARGARSRDGSSSARTFVAPSSAPPTDAWRNVRRFIGSVQIEEFVRIEKHVTEVRERLRRQELARCVALVVPGRPQQREPERPVDTRVRVGARLALD